MRELLLISFLLGSAIMHAFSQGEDHFPQSRTHEIELAMQIFDSGFPKTYFVSKKRIGFYNYLDEFEYLTKDRLHGILSRDEVLRLKEWVSHDTSMIVDNEAYLPHGVWLDEGEKNIVLNGNQEYMNKLVLDSSSTGPEARYSCLNLVYSLSSIYWTSDKRIGIIIIRAQPDLRNEVTFVCLFTFKDGKFVKIEKISISSS